MDVERVFNTWLVETKSMTAYQWINVILVALAAFFVYQQFRR